MRRFFLAAALAALPGPSDALAQAADPPHTSTAMSAKTSGFIAAFSLRNLFAFESARLAAARARGAALREAARTLLRDHARAASELERLTLKRQLATPEDELNPRHQARLEALRRTDDASFDRAYVELQHVEQAETLALVERYARKGDDRALKRFAQDQVPVLRRHADLLRRLP